MLNFIKAKKGQTEDWFADLPVGLVLIAIGIAVLSLFSGSYEDDINLEIAQDINENLVRASALSLLRTQVDIEGMPEQDKGKQLIEILPDMSTDSNYGIGCAELSKFFKEQLRYDGFAVYTRSWQFDTENQYSYADSIERILVLL